MSSFRGRDGRTNLHASTLDLLAAGSETTASLLEWVALYLASHPENQRKVSEDEQYALAFLEEVLRHCPGLSLLSPARATTRATVFRGHRLPAGTHVHAYNGAANFDQKVFGASAKEFDPSRFMDNDGTFIRLGIFAINHEERFPDIIFYSHDRSPTRKLGAFGHGSRRCPGEAAARAAALEFVRQASRLGVSRVWREGEEDEEYSFSGGGGAEEEEDQGRKADFPVWPREFSVRFQIPDTHRRGT